MSPVITVVGYAVFCAVLFTPLTLCAQDAVRDLVVKIHAMRRSPDLLRPWTTQNPRSISGSGVVIQGKHILTNAHVVQHASQIYVQPNQSAEKVLARVVAIAPGIDLALLKLEEDSSLRSIGFLPFAEELPGIKETVNVYGYPTGGTELSVTEGIISRIEFASYYQFTTGLRLQVDAALNAGNSGGPAVSNGRLVGLVFSRIPSAQNIGYLIPVEEIRLFLDDVMDGVYDGKPQILDMMQTVENDALRSKLSLPRTVGGLMVTKPYREDGDYPLKEWDVIVRIGDQAIDREGKVAIRYDLRVSALYLVQKAAQDGKLEVMVHRNGVSSPLIVPVVTERELVLPYLMNYNPRYFIYGPLVFTQATQEYLERLGEQWERFLSRQGSPLLARRYDKPTFKGEEIVVVASPMFPHRITKGYDDPNASVLEEVNGIRIRNLNHLVETLRDSSDPQAIFKFAKRAPDGQETMIFDRREVTGATEEILNENGIRYPYSRDLGEIWEATSSTREKSKERPAL